MERIKFVQHRGVRVLQVDFSDCSAPEVLEVQKQAMQTIAKEPERSVLLVSLVSNAHFSREVNHQMKEYVKNNERFVKASAVVGVSGLQGIVINAAIDSAGRPISVFDDVEKAKNWLVEIAQPNGKRLF